MPIKYDPFRDDQEAHTVSMDRKARYRGDFRKVIDPAPKVRRDPTEWQKQFTE